MKLPDATVVLSSVRPGINSYETVCTTEVSVATKVITTVPKKRELPVTKFDLTTIKILKPQKRKLPVTKSDSTTIKNVIAPKSKLPNSEAAITPFGLLSVYQMSIPVL